jgi:hypothetical protein
MDASENLCLKQCLTEVLVNVEQHNLSISTSNANLVVSYSLDTLNALSADILSENEELVFHLERAKVSTECTSEKEFLAWFAESKARVVSNKRSCVNELMCHLAICRIKLREN